MLSLQARDYDTGEPCFVPTNDQYANTKYYLGLLVPGIVGTAVRL